MEILIVIVFLIFALIVVHFATKKDFQPNELFSNIKGYVPTKFEIPKVTRDDKLRSLYSPFVIRPKDIYSRRYEGNCTNELYPSATSKFGKGEMNEPCCPTTAGKYYGMRPILTPETLQKMIKMLYDNVLDKNVPEHIDQSRLTNQNKFCDDNSYTKVMKFILGKLNRGKAEMSIFKDYAKADTWGGDQFAYLNQQVYMFTSDDPSKLSEQEQAKRARKKHGGDVKYVVTFTLYMPLRSTSLDTTAIVLESKSKYYLTYLDFTTKDVVTGNEPVGVNVPGGNIIQPDVDGLPPQQNTPNWIYGNTLENVTFNQFGFHDPDEKNNILIPGGIPDEYIKVLEKCDNAYLAPSNGFADDRFAGGYQDNRVYPNFPDTNRAWKLEK